MSLRVVQVVRGVWYVVRRFTGSAPLVEDPRWHARFRDGRDLTESLLHVEERRDRSNRHILFFFGICLSQRLKVSCYLRTCCWTRSSQGEMCLSTVVDGRDTAVISVFE